MYRGLKTARGFDLMLRLETYAHFRNFFVSMMVINAVSSFLASVLNFLTILTFVKTTSLRTPSYILILSLAISDFGVAVVVQPAYILVSFLTVTAVTMDRFLAIHLHLRRRLLRTPSYILILSLAISDFGVAVVVQPAYILVSFLTVTAVTMDRFLAIHLHLSSFLASVLNFLTILTFVKTTSLRTPSYILILSLAISDFGVAVVVQPAYILVSFLTVTAVTMDRFLAIHLHLSESWVNGHQEAFSLFHLSPDDIRDKEDDDNSASDSDYGSDIFSDDDL
ncbi:hypothetical protein QZH41_007512 [Actinostola sp. cb2023]|nr:hypothetical protein QZH41_007512 [Actinostola sp. cb2023]